MTNLRLAICVIVAASVTAESAQAQIIASSGFNDASGINGNPTPNSPFNINNQPLLGQGAGEPGWFTPWNNALGVGQVVSASQFEGDGAVLMQGTNIANRVLAQPLTGLRTGVTALQILSSATSGNGVNFYIRQQSTGAIGPNWQLSGDGRIRVVAGNESGSTPLVDTGFLWTPGAYQVFGTHVNTATRRWMLSVDGVFFPMELGYRESPVFLDTVDFLNGVGAPNGTMIDNVIVQVPEPTSMALLGIALSGFVSATIRRQKTRTAA